MYFQCTKRLNFPSNSQISLQTPSVTLKFHYLFSCHTLHLWMKISFGKWNLILYPENLYYLGGGPKKNCSFALTRLITTSEPTKNIFTFSVPPTLFSDLFSPEINIFGLKTFPRIVRTLWL